MSVTGYPGMDPVAVGAPLADVVAGLFAAYTIVSTLHAVKKDGRGHYVDLSMQATMLATLGPRMGGALKPIRTALFAPGSNQRVMTKALESGADAVILDLEDSVPIASKADARKLVTATIGEVAARESRPGIFVRTNATTTGFLPHDIAAVVRPGLDAVILPKAETVEEVRDAAALIAQHEAEQGLRAGSVEIMLMIESALGVYRCFDLINASPRVGSCCIGSAQDGDLQTDLGCGWSREGTELLYARSKVLLDTRAAGAHIVPLDGVFSNLGDEASLIQDSELSARLGALVIRFAARAAARGGDLYDEKELS